MEPNANTLTLKQKSQFAFVVLEHLTLPDRGRKFWTTNKANNTHSSKGELWYREIHFTDNADEAIALSQTPNYDALATTKEIYAHITASKSDI